MAKSKVQAFYRVIKGERGHPFAGLYAVEKVFYKDGKLLKREIIHEWDLRIISEAVLAKVGGGDAYESFKLDHEIAELEKEPGITVVAPRTAEELALTPKKLEQELTIPKESPVK